MDHPATSESELPRHPHGTVIPSGASGVGQRTYSAANRVLQPDKAAVLRAALLKNLEREQRGSA